MSLLDKFLPIFHCDKNEKFMCVNGNIFFETSQIFYDNTVVAHIIEKNNKKYLYYYVIYTQDGGKELLCYTVDSHPLDIEGVIVELNENDKITGLCYQPHGTKENFWIKDQTDLDQICVGNRPKVYISKGKHASYPIPGRIYRIYFFGNDNCDSPKKMPYIPIEMSTHLQKTVNYGAMNGFPSRLSKDLSIIPTIRLSELKYKSLLYKFW